jgi:hypothetical protein
MLALAAAEEEEEAVLVLLLAAEEVEYILMVKDHPVPQDQVIFQQQAAQEANLLLV